MTFTQVSPALPHSPYGNVRRVLEEIAQGIARAQSAGEAEALPHRHLVCRQYAGPSQTGANLLIESTGNLLVPGWYMAIAGVIGLVSVLCMRETAQARLRGEELPVAPESVGLPKPRHVERNRADAEARRASFSS